VDAERITEADRLPKLRSGPVRLRGFEPTDLGLVEAAAADPLIPLISTVPSPFSKVAGRRFIEAQRHRLAEGYGYSFVITEGASGDPVGSIGLWLRDLDLGRATVGYWVIGPARGRRVATNALQAVSRWALVDLAVPRLELSVEPWNEPSIRTAEANGFVREGLLRGYQPVGTERRDVYLYSLLRTDLD
jgi:RimJ/RimL family protein N-acetyltransferase